MNSLMVLSRTRPLVGIIGVAFLAHGLYALNNSEEKVMNRRNDAAEMLLSEVVEYSESERVRLNKRASQNWFYEDAPEVASASALGGTICLASLVYSAKSSRIVNRWKRRRGRYEGIDVPSWLFRII